MTAIGDSNAVRIAGGQLPQHQSALTLLQGRLAAPNAVTLGWLDLACGRGQILEGLADSLSDQQRAKVRYTAYDVDQNYARETRHSASALGLAGIDVHVGDLADFHTVIPGSARFDFITLTNTVHEVAPNGLAPLLAGVMRRMTERGVAFIYDMERIKPPELGALPWTGVDIRVIVRTLVEALGATDYHPAVGTWHHRTVDGWNVQLERQYIPLSDIELDIRLPVAILATCETIETLLRRRLAACEQTLAAFTDLGVETVEEIEDKEHLLHEYWALTRAIGATE